MIFTSLKILENINSKMILPLSFSEHRYLVDIQVIRLNYAVCVLNNLFEGSISQNFDLGQSVHFM